MCSRLFIVAGWCFLVAGCGGVGSSLAQVEETGPPIGTQPVAATAASTDPSTPVGEFFARLEQARRTLQSTEDYKAEFEQQVRKDDELTEPQKMELKLKHQPFAVYLQWKNDGQEALYAEGETEGNVIVKPKRGLAALRGRWELEPDSTLAMKDSRRPITEIGLKNLVDRFFEYRQALEGGALQIDDVSRDGTSMTRFTFTFENPQTHPEFSKTVVYLEDRNNFPLGTENYGWTDDGKPGPLVEKYVYRNVQLEQGVDEADFDPEKLDKRD